MEAPTPEPPESSAPQSDVIHSESFLHSLMARQLKLSIACALTFLGALLGLPLANYFAPELMAKRVFGFTLTWLVLGVLFFPFVWIISFFFIRRSIALESAEVREVVATLPKAETEESGSHDSKIPMAPHLQLPRNDEKGGRR